jgi:arylsulfatase A-like enzyme
MPTSRLWPIKAAAIAFTFLSVACFRHHAIGTDIKNVIVLSVDALSCQALRAYNPKAPEHPAIDGFSQRAVRFTKAYSAASWTLPANASLFTALYPDRHGAVRAGKRLSDDHETLANLFHEAGFETVAFTDHGYMSGNYGFGHGFKRYNAWTASQPWRPSLRLYQNGEEDRRLLSRGIAYLKDVGEEDPPFFLFLHTYHVHDYFKRRLGNDIDESLKPCLFDISHCSLVEWEQLKDSYHERVRELDEAFGRLLAVLEESGLRESTLVLFTSDHGEGFDVERGRVHHTGRLHIDLTQVPLLISGPHLSPRSVRESVSLIDVMPTLLELVGLQPERDIDGISFAAKLYRGKDTGEIPKRPSRTLFAMEYAYRWEEGRRIDVKRDAEVPSSVAAIRDSFYYIKTGDLEELYDIVADPEQQKNLVGESAIIASFRKALEGRSMFTAAGAPMEIDEDLRKQLQSLGYIH